MHQQFIVTQDKEFNIASSENYFVLPVLSYELIMIFSYLNVYPQDVPYLDLCVYPPKSSRHNMSVEGTVEFDKLSICSMESVHIPSRPLPQVNSLVDDLVCHFSKKKIF